MTAQLDSRHFFRARDTVQHLDGYVGTVVEQLALFAIVLWTDGTRQEIEQFDSRIAVVERAETR